MAANVQPTIEEEYIAKHSTSEKLYRRAWEVMTSGIHHDTRYMKPFPFYIARADKARKWDVDGNELIDLWSGHGGLILGHNHPDVVAAVKEQAEKGFHYSACHEKEVELAELIVRMVPCAEKIRYVQTGLEACSLAIRIARAYTGKDKFIKFRGHFHGYFDEVMVGVRPPHDAPMSIGVPKTALSNVLLARHNHSEDVLRLIEASRNDIACVIMDPVCHAFVMANKPGFLEEVRRITREKGVVLIFDEVWSGFRLAPGGAQEVLGVTPDLTAIAKGMVGGLPGSAVVGKKEIMDVMTFTGDPEHDRFHRVISQGTHSGNPMIVACALATLKILSTGEPQRYINRLGDKLRKNLNEVVKKHNVPGCVYGNWSVVRNFIGAECPFEDPLNPICDDHERVDRAASPKVRDKLYLAMHLNGVDYSRGLGLMQMNAALTEEDIEKVTDAYDRSLLRLKQEKIL